MFDEFSYQWLETPTALFEDGCGRKVSGYVLTIRWLYRQLREARIKNK